MNFFLALFLAFIIYYFVYRYGNEQLLLFTMYKISRCKLLEIFYRFSIVIVYHLNNVNSFEESNRFVIILL